MRASSVQLTPLRRQLAGRFDRLPGRSSHFSEVFQFAAPPRRAKARQARDLHTSTVGNAARPLIRRQDSAMSIHGCALSDGMYQTEARVASAHRRRNCWPEREAGNASIRRSAAPHTHRSPYMAVANVDTQSALPPPPCPDRRQRRETRPRAPTDPPPAPTTAPAKPTALPKAWPALRRFATR